MLLMLGMSFATSLIRVFHEALFSYLLSPQTSSVGGHGTPGARLTVIGSKNPANAFKDPDSVIFSEILEFSMSLVPTVKGQEPFHGLPHLQAYRFIRAAYLTEIGDMQLASR